MIRGVVIPKHEHKKFLALSNPSDLLDLSRTHSVFWGLAAKTRLITHSNAPVMAAVTFRCSCLGIVKHCYPATLFPRSGAAGFRFARRRLLTVIASAYLSAVSGAVEASFWKRGSFRSGSNMGSSRSTAGVSGMPIEQKPPLGIESSF